MFRKLAIAGTFVIGSVVTVGAGIMDASDCKNGPNSYRSGLEGVLDELDKRVVACFNYSQDIEIENHNEQVDSINRLVGRIADLELAVSSLEGRIDDLESR